MSYQDFARTAAGVLAGALLAGGAIAQTQKPEPATMVDTAPPPAHDRSSTGAVIMMDEPVLAQREAIRQAQERSAVDTRALGAGPSRILRRPQSREEIEFLKALEAAEREKGRR
jgi:hypothetical protein